MNNFTRAALALGACAAIITLAFAQDPGEHRTVMPDDLKWAKFPALPPGAKIGPIEGSMAHAMPFTVRFKLPKDYEVPAHSHPVVQRITVLSGTLHIGRGDKFDRSKTKSMPPGAISIVRPGTNYFVWTTEEVIVQVHGVGPWDIAYIDPLEDPRRKIVEFRSVGPWGMPHSARRDGGEQSP